MIYCIYCSCTDNELPDYVMVLVANKKSQEQMEEDLRLFLGESTVSFTTWLYEILRKLERFTISSKGILLDVLFFCIVKVMQKLS